MPDLHLTAAEADELLLLLDGALGDLSFEIADADNPEFQAVLRERRRRLSAIRAPLLADRTTTS